MNFQGWKGWFVYWEVEWRHCWSFGKIPFIHYALGLCLIMAVTQIQPVHISMSIFIDFSSSLWKYSIFFCFFFQLHLVFYTNQCDITSTHPATVLSFVLALYPNFSIKILILNYLVKNNEIMENKTSRLTWIRLNLRETWDSRGLGDGVVLGSFTPTQLNRYFSFFLSLAIFTQHMLWFNRFVRLDSSA